MGMNLENFNRIIDIVFISTTADGTPTGNVKSIICPRHGIKPEIEINGTFGGAFVLQAFDITIKNLYVDLRAEPYSKIKVRAGYANNYIDFEADIFNMYRETPGPEGTTVIQCKKGSVTKNWLDAYVALNYPTKTNILDILGQIKKKLKIDEVMAGEKARTLNLETEMQFDGSARGALADLEKRFAKDNLKIYMQGNKICAICVTEGDFVNTRILKYMSAPPQQNPGDENGNWHSMITAPWMPDLMPGDQLVIPSQIYVNSGTLVGGASPTQRLLVTQMSFHFGTRGSVNQMTCEGYIKR